MVNIMLLVIIMHRVGIPRGLFYYYDKDIWKYFLKYLNIKCVVSPNTNREIMNAGIKYSNDEMCLAMKVYLGHVFYLKDKCDYILIPRIDNFYSNNQTCTNFLSVYDIVKNIFDVKVLNYNIDLENGDTLKKGLIKIGKELGKTRIESIKAYKYAVRESKKIREKDIIKNEKKLNGRKTKILIVSHPYNIYDSFVGKEIIDYLEKNKIAIIYSDKFDSKVTNNLSKELSRDLYFVYSKDNLGSIVYAMDKIDGIIFLSAFPCALDSISLELAMRKVDKPYITLVLDDNDSFTGIETRLESFIDVLRGNING